MLGIGRREFITLLGGAAARGRLRRALSSPAEPPELEFCPPQTLAHRLFINHLNDDCAILATSKARTLSSNIGTPKERLIDCPISPPN